MADGLPDITIPARAWTSVSQAYQDQFSHTVRSVDRAIFLTTAGATMRVCNRASAPGRDTMGAMYAYKESPPFAEILATEANDTWIFSNRQITVNLSYND